MSRILVTGGNSFIAKSIIPYLEKCGHYVFAPNKLQLNLLNDLDLFDAFKNDTYDYLIMCSQIGGRRTHKDNPQDLYDNLRMLNNILYYQSKYKFKLITFDSAASYDRRNNLFNVREYEFFSIPQDYYGFFKYTQNQLIKNNKNIINLRLFNVFSNESNKMDDSFISTCIKNCLNNEPIEIWNNIYFTTFYSEDLAILINYLILDNNKNNKFIDYNCGYSKNYRLSEIATLIKKLTNSKSEIIIKQPIGKNYSGDCSRLYSLGLKFNGLENGILNCIKEYENDIKT